MPSEVLPHTPCLINLKKIPTCILVTVIQNSIFTMLMCL